MRADYIYLGFDPIAFGVSTETMGKVVLPLKRKHGSDENDKSESGDDGDQSDSESPNADSAPAPTTHSSATTTTAHSFVAESQTDLAHSVAQSCTRDLERLYASSPNIKTFMPPELIASFEIWALALYMDRPGDRRPLTSQCVSSFGKCHKFEFLNCIWTMGFDTLINSEAKKPAVLPKSVVTCICKVAVSKLQNGKCRIQNWFEVVAMIRE